MLVHFVFISNTYERDLDSPLLGPSPAGNVMGDRSVRMSRVQRFGEVLTLLGEGNLSLFVLVLEILNDCKPEYTGCRVKV